ncbi:MAG: zinc ribbon domain-containing protein [Chloroflexi bacterium]|nr:zinc ribbon domain-containing protein [Chloroflexota bacterium]
MPTYEFKCPACHIHFEVKNGFSQDAHGTCPKCQAEGQRVYNSVLVLFKGPGFYSTDNNRVQEYPSSPSKKEEPLPANTPTPTKPFGEPA